MINPPSDEPFFKLVKAASLKKIILQSSTFPRLGYCKITFSDFNFRIFLLATIKSLTVESFIDTDTSYAPKLMSGLVWLDVQFDCPANPFNYCQASSVVKGLSLDILLSLVILTSFNLSVYISWSK